jgi:hypothetical protein
MNELETQRLRFYRLANGAMAIGYIAFFAWVLATLYNMIF